MFQKRGACAQRLGALNGLHLRRPHKVTAGPFFSATHISTMSFGGAMESTDIADSQTDAKELGLDRFVAIYIAVLAVLLSIGTVGGGNSTKDATRTNIQATDTWAFYQAKSMRQTTYRVAAEGLQLKLAEPGLPETVRKQIAEKAAAYQAEIDRLESEPQKGEGKKELAAKAREFEKDRDAALKQDPYFDYAQAFLQIAIVLASASIVLKNRSLLVGSGLLGILGFLLMLNGFTLAIDIPFLA
jgi:hypothetical protein